MCGALSNQTDDLKRRIELLWHWRDAIARSEDESVGYVMSTQLLFKIAKAEALEESEVRVPPASLPRPFRSLGLTRCPSRPGPRFDLSVLAESMAQPDRPS